MAHAPGNQCRDDALGGFYRFTHQSILPDAPANSCGERAADGLITRILR